MFNVNSTEYRQAATALNYEIEVVFRKNLKYFESNEPDLYQLFKSYKPQTLQLRLSAEGYLNLVNINTGKPVYPINPLEYAQKQVAIHLESRPVFALNLMLPENGLEGYPYTKCISQLDKEYDKVYAPSSVCGSKEVPQMFMFGGGLFLQLEPLLNSLDIKSLTIFDANHDALFASCHLVDWSQIYEYFSREGYNLNFNIAKSDETDLKKIAQIYFDKGFHHFQRIEQYFHYYNDEISNLSNKFKSHLQAIIGSQGFFEDERIGMAHTLKNLEKKYPINTKNLFLENDISSIPVMLIGNGPSLDELIEQVQKNKNNCIVVSCGSALSALIKNGIKPDIHVEQERMSLVADWIEESTDQNDRKGISLITLNPSHPRTFDLFESSYMALKPEDLGTDLIIESGHDNGVLSNNCLPLVGNFGLSAMLSLGFKTIYMIGIDCGMIDKKLHHSEDSNYYNDDNRHSETVIDNNSLFGFLKVKGNIRSTVTSTPLFNHSRIELEALLARYKPDCYNLSDGAYIQGARPLGKENFVTRPLTLDKTADLNIRFDKAYSGHDISGEDIENLICEHVLFFNQQISAIRKKFDLEGMTVQKISEQFDLLEIMLKAIRVSDPVVYRLINGSVRGLAYKISVAKYNLDNESYQEFYKVAKPLINDFFDEVTKDMNERFFSI